MVLLGFRQGDTTHYQGIIIPHGVGAKHSGVRYHRIPSSPSGARQRGESRGERSASQFSGCGIQRTRLWHIRMGPSMCGDLWEPESGENINLNLKRHLKLTFQIFEHPYVVSQIGDNPESNLYMRGIVCFIRNNKALPRLRVGFDRIYIYQALEKELGLENGLFTLVPGSHREKADSVERQTEIQIRLSPGQSLLVDGNMVIRYPQAGGGLCIMAAYWKKKDNL